MAWSGAPETGSRTFRPAKPEPRGATTAPSSSTMEALAPQRSGSPFRGGAMMWIPPRSRSWWSMPRRESACGTWWSSEWSEPRAMSSSSQTRALRSTTSTTCRGSPRAATIRRSRTLTISPTRPIRRGRQTRRQRSFRGLERCGSNRSTISTASFPWRSLPLKPRPPPSWMGRLVGGRWCPSIGTARCGCGDSFPSIGPGRVGPISSRVRCSATRRSRFSSRWSQGTRR